MRLVLSLSLALFALPALCATVRGPADIAALTASADAVVHARVVHRSSDWAGGTSKSGLIYTRVVLEPIEVWKGSAKAFVVRVPGGAAGDYDQIVQGTAHFEPGEEVVVYLRKLAPGIFDVSHWALGKFSISAASPASGKRALRDRAGLSCVGCGGDEADELSLEELRTRTLRAAGGKQ